MLANAQLPPPDLTPWHMFQSADLVVKAVIVLLLLASVVTWTILLAKWLEIWRWPTAAAGDAGIGQ